jgi:lipoprotein signal peptidase
VIVTLGQENGLIVPLIAVHLFVFLFRHHGRCDAAGGACLLCGGGGVGGDPITTGFVAFFYSLRTAALPFLFIFNTELLLIDVSIVQGIFIFCVATLAMLLFAAATQGWFLARNRMWESAALLLLAFTFFQPGLLDGPDLPALHRSGTDRDQRSGRSLVPSGEYLRLKISGLDDVGDTREWVVLLDLPDGATGDERLEAAGLTLVERDGKTIIDDVAFGSAAQDIGLDWDQEIVQVLKPASPPSKYFMYLPALLLLGFVVMIQRRRVPAPSRSEPAAQEG